MLLVWFLRSILIFYVKMATLTGLQLLVLRGMSACSCGRRRRC